MKISPFNEDTIHLSDFHHIFFKYNEYNSYSFFNQIRSFPSYLYLNLIENNTTCKKLDKCYIQGKKNIYILNGITFLIYSI